jgi:hypothetical protein
MIKLRFGDHPCELGGKVLRLEEEDVSSITNLAEIPLTDTRLLPEVLKLHNLESLSLTSVREPISLKDGVLNILNPRKHLFLSLALQEECSL